MTIREYGITPSGERIMEITLQSATGFRVKVLTWGGIITEMMAANRSGVRDNVVLHYDTLEDYLENPVYLGATIGRWAGRMAEGQMHMDGRLIQLDTSRHRHALHGGSKGLHGQNWIISEATQQRLVLTCHDEAEQGKTPGNMTFEAIYSVEAESLQIEFRATTDEKTYVNLTNHSYFNLTGHPGVDIKGHGLKLNSDVFAAVDEGNVPYEQLVDVSLTPFDFRAKKSIGEGIHNPHTQIQRCKGYDHPFKLSGGDQSIVLSEPLSGRVLTLSTNQPYAVIYSGNFLDADIAPSGKRFKAHEGICFETQDIPNAPNRQDFSRRYLMPDDEYIHRTTYSFTHD